MQIDAFLEFLEDKTLATEQCYWPGPNLDTESYLLK